MLSGSEPASCRDHEEADTRVEHVGDRRCRAQPRQGQPPYRFRAGAADGPGIGPDSTAGQPGVNESKRKAADTNVLLDYAKGAALAQDCFATIRQRVSRASVVVLPTVIHGQPRSLETVRRRQPGRALVSDRDSRPVT